MLITSSSEGETFGRTGLGLQPQTMKWSQLTEKWKDLRLHNLKILKCILGAIRIPVSHEACLQTQFLDHMCSLIIACKIQDLRVSASSTVPRGFPCTGTLQNFYLDK